MHQDVRRLFKDFWDTLYLQVYSQAHAQCVHACSTMPYTYTCQVSVLYCPTTTLVEHDNTVVMLWRQSGRALSGCKPWSWYIGAHHTHPQHNKHTQPQQSFKQPHTCRSWASHRKVTNFNVLCFNNLCRPQSLCYLLRAKIQLSELFSYDNMLLTIIWYRYMY